MKFYKLIVVVILGLFPTVASPLTQGGGKAEPKTLPVKNNQINTIISGSIKGAEEAEYGFTVRKGGRLRVIVESVPRGTGGVKLMMVDGKSPNLTRVFDDYNADVKRGGEYVISVYRATKMKGRTNYRVKIIYKPIVPNTKSRIP